MNEQPRSRPPANLPGELTALLEARDAAAQERAWTEFLNTYSRLVLHVARSLGSEHDAVMDRYAYALEQLRAREFARLRCFAPEGCGKFSTWLTVVIRRMCLDHHRQLYGRSRNSADEGSNPASREVRKRLVNLIAAELDAATLVSPAQTPEARLRQHELDYALATALSELDHRDRLLLAMRFEHDLSAREIVAVMDFPTPFHVYRRLNVLLASLRRDLERSGFDDPVP